MNELLTALMLWVAANSPLPVPDMIPEVRQQDPITMACVIEQIVPCDPNLLEPRNVWYGYYMTPILAPPNGAVVVNSAVGLESVMAHSVLLHETIHHMQVAVGQKHNTECQAYKLQDQWLNERGSNLMLAFRMNLMNYMLKTTCYAP